MGKESSQGILRTFFAFDKNGRQVKRVYKVLISQKDSRILRPLNLTPLILEFKSKDPNEAPALHAARHDSCSRWWVHI